MRRRFLCAAMLAAAVPVEAAPTAKNVVILVADGAGYNTWEASTLWQGNRGSSFHDAPGWVEVAVSTYALRDRREPADSDAGPGDQDPGLVYDPARAWDPTPVEGEAGGYPYCFEGYRWLRRAPDSANSATAISTGRATYVRAINCDGREQPIRETLAWLAKREGRRVGVVTSVPLSHATPAALGGAHGPDRSAYCSLAFEMLTSGTLDVIAGCGNPDYDNNGEPVAAGTGSCRYVGGRAVWSALTRAAELREGDVACGEHPGEERVVTAEEASALREWRLVQSKRAIERLVGGGTPEKLLVVPEVGEVAFWTGDGESTVGATLQQERGSRADPRTAPPGWDPPTPNVPTLETLTRVALNALDDDPDGFFLHVEGGAVDWAMHSNQIGRMIEEMIDFERSVAAVVEWVEAHGGWDETLVIVTSDHDHLLWGPQSNERPFQPLEDRGPGRLPGYRWLLDDHSSALVPLFARGAGADAFLELATKEDPVRGRYLHHTDVFAGVVAAMEGSGVEGWEPPPR